MKGLPGFAAERGCSPSWQRTLQGRGKISNRGHSLDASLPRARHLRGDGAAAKRSCMEAVTAQTRFGNFLRARQVSSERTRLYRLGDHLRKRLAQALDAPPQNPITTMESQTDRIHRLLVLWLDLQQAVRQAKVPHTVPWECHDKDVARLWEQITDPKNQRALEEWLFQVAPGELELWAQHALLESRRRRKEA